MSDTPKFARGGIVTSTGHAHVLVGEPIRGLRYSLAALRCPECGHSEPAVASLRDRFHLLTSVRPGSGFLCPKAHPDAEGHTPHSDARLVEVTPV